VKTMGSWVLAAVLAVVGWNAFPQVISEFRDTEPGSAVFGTLHLLICVTAAASAIGVIRRARWAAWSIWGCGISAGALLLAQPLYESMADDAKQSIWMGVGVASVAALGMGWLARRLADSASIPNASIEQLSDAQPTDAWSPSAAQPAPRSLSERDAPARRSSTDETRDAQ
jgi:hypothetical protein